MTLTELAKRVADLENELTEMKQKMARAPEALPWWMTGTGRSGNDPAFDEIIRLGQEYRKSLHPEAKKKKPRKR